MALPLPFVEPQRNFAVVDVDGGYTSGDTSITLQSGEASKLPDPSSEGSFWLVWWDASSYTNPTDDPNREIVLVTAISGDTLTVTRGTQGTAATDKNSGTYKMARAYTKGDRDSLENSFRVSVALGWFPLVDSGGNEVGLSYVSGSGQPTAVLETSSQVDIRDIIDKGTKLKFDDNGTKYAKIVDTPTLNNSKTRFTILTTFSISGGSITNPFFSHYEQPHGWDQPRDVVAKLEATSNQTISTGTITEVAYDTASDPFGIADTGDNKIDIPLDGLYFIQGYISWDNINDAGVRIEHFPQINGNNQVGYRDTTDTSFPYCPFSRYINFNSGDTIKSVCKHTDSDSAILIQDINATYHTFLYIKRVGGKI